MTLDGNLAAESAGVTGVLRSFDLLHLLAEGGTIAGEPMLAAILDPSNVLMSAKGVVVFVRGVERTGYRIYR